MLWEVMTYPGTSKRHNVPSTSEQDLFQIYIRKFSFLLPDVINMTLQLLQMPCVGPETRLDMERHAVPYTRKEGTQDLNTNTALSRVAKPALLHLPRPCTTSTSSCTAPRREITGA